jgi:hypothetical protein
MGLPLGPQIKFAAWTFRPYTLEEKISLIGSFQGNLLQ